MLTPWQKGETPLYAAASRAHALVVKLLADSSADLDRQDLVSVCHELKLSGGGPDCGSLQEGCTPLMVAARNGHKDVVELLLERGASQSPTNNQGQSAAQLAKRPDVQLLFKTVAPVTNVAVSPPSSTYERDFAAGVI